jgi:hypothetical protein
MTDCISFLGQEPAKLPRSIIVSSLLCRAEAVRLGGYGMVAEAVDKCPPVWIKDMLKSVSKAVDMWDGDMHIV